MKKVLITSIAYPHPPDVVDGLRPFMYGKLARRNITPLIASAYMNPASIDELYNMADGVIFSGGADLDPGLYHQRPRETTSNTEPKRDKLEWDIVQRVFADKKPCIGICRGMQLLNVCAGGTLHQVLGEVHPTENHGGGTHENKPKELIDFDIVVSPDTQLYNLLGCGMVTVVCNHHQCIDALGDGFIASAHSPAGVVEVIEHVDADFFCFGIQSHPEVVLESGMSNVFDAFAQAL